MKASVSEHLEGFVCLRCQHRYGVEDLFEGCPRCRAEGHASSVVASYRGPIGQQAGPRIPILGAPTLGEGDTPLIPLGTVARELDLAFVGLKAEYLNPTGSHKDRMSRFAVARAKLAGYKEVVAASSGNAGVSLAAYAARSGLSCTILMTIGHDQTSWARQIRRFGGRVVAAPSKEGRWEQMEAMVEAGGPFPVTNYRTPPAGSNPFGVEGYKSAGYELFKQTGGDLDVALVPTARGDLLWGVWAGMSEAAAAEGRPLRTRMVAVEPLPRLSRILAGEDYRATFPGETLQVSTGGDTATWQSVHTLQASGGLAVEVDDPAALAWQDRMRSLGIALERCSAAPLEALRLLRQRGQLASGGRAAILATSDGRHEPADL